MVLRIMFGIVGYLRIFGTFGVFGLFQIFEFFRQTSAWTPRVATTENARDVVTRFVQDTRKTVRPLHANHAIRVLLGGFDDGTGWVGCFRSLDLSDHLVFPDLQQPMPQQMLKRRVGLDDQVIVLDHRDFNKQPPPHRAKIELEPGTAIADGRNRVKLMG